MSGSTVKPQGSYPKLQEYVTLPHPNKHSEYYDKIFNPGPFDPKTKTHTQHIDVKKYTYDQWAKEILSPQAAKKAKKSNLNKVPLYK